MSDWEQGAGCFGFAGGCSPHCDCHLRRGLWCAGMVEAVPLGTGLGRQRAPDYAAWGKTEDEEQSPPARVAYPHQLAAKTPMRQYGRRLGGVHFVRRESRYFAPSQRISGREMPAGLMNLGNTCYINAALQARPRLYRQLFGRAFIIRTLCYVGTRSVYLFQQTGKFVL